MWARRAPLRGTGLSDKGLQGRMQPRLGLVFTYQVINNLGMARIGHSDERMAWSLPSAWHPATGGPSR